MERENGGLTHKKYPESRQGAHMESQTGVGKWGHYNIRGDLIRKGLSVEHMGVGAHNISQISGMRNGG